MPNMPVRNPCLTDSVYIKEKPDEQEAEIQKGERYVIK